MKKYLKHFLEFYRKYFGTNEDFLIFRDFTLLILLLIVVIMVSIKSKQPIKDLLNVLSLVFNKDKLKSRGHQNEITQNLAILDRLESNKNSVTIMPEKNSEQKVEIEKEVIDLKSLKNVSSNVDVIIDSIENFSKNITKRNERKNGKKEGCNVCKLPCV
jgi:hypothetical protein